MLALTGKKNTVDMLWITDTVCSFLGDARYNIMMQFIYVTLMND